MLLRIEDHDRERCRPEYETALLDDLDWLGFVPDIYPTDLFRAGRCESRQSDRGAIYDDMASRLQAAGLLYACRCTRKVLGPGSGVLGPESGGPGPGSGVPGPGSDAPEARYPGTCRDLALPLEGDVGWRVRMPDETVTFTDQWCGPQTQTPANQCGDLLIRDRRGNWSYQLVAAVDDFLQGITHVIRGVDLLASTGRQMLLARLLGRPAPANFAHHGLIMKSATQKLSKSDGDTGVRDLRIAGWTRDQVLTAAVLPGERSP